MLVFLGRGGFTLHLIHQVIMADNLMVRVGDLVNGGFESYHWIKEKQGVLIR